MIGLGSNRLSVCRRGGMSVTQAGRGGMEWLAGHREPIWSSPYSAQATAALKDAFTAAQWEIINAYGRTTPYLDAINAFAPEDPYIMYSLIPELGYNRQILFDGNTWFDTGVAFSACTEVYAEVYLLRTNMATFGNRASSWAGLLQWTSTLYVNNISAGSYSEGWADVVVTPTWMTYNGNKRTYNTTFNSSNLLLGIVNSATNSKNTFRTFGYKENGIDHLWIPCYKGTGNNRIKGMLDLTMASFKENQGTGDPTISETPAS